jgi:cytochrome b561
VDTEQDDQQVCVCVHLSVYMNCVDMHVEVREQSWVSFYLFFFLLNLLGIFFIYISNAIPFPSFLSYTPQPPLPNPPTPTLESLTGQWVSGLHQFLAQDYKKAASYLALLNMNSGPQHFTSWAPISSQGAFFYHTFYSCLFILLPVLQLDRGSLLVT